MQQRRCCRFPVRAGNADQDGAVGVFRQQFDIADNRAVGFPGADHDRMRPGMCQRYARAQHQGRELRPVRGHEIRERYVLVRGFRPGIGVVVPCRDSRAAGHQRMSGRAAGAAESEDRQVL